jgi:membrane-associated phospholipid phosphatase
MRGTWRRGSRPGPVPQALLPGRLRWPAAALLAACVAVAVVLAVHFAGRGQPGWGDAEIDPRVTAWMSHWPGLLYRLPDLGTPGPVALITAALVLACAAARRWTGAVLAAGAEPAAVGLTEYVLKPLVGRGAAESLPSGHATSMFALAAICAILLLQPPRRRAPGAVRWLLAIAALIVAGTVSAAMVAIGAHYFTDVVAGAAVGTGLVLACALILDLATSLARRAQARRARADDGPQRPVPGPPVPGPPVPGPTAYPESRG